MLLAPASVTAEGAVVVVEDGVGVWVACGVWVAFGVGAGAAVEVDGAGVWASTPAVLSSRAANSNGTSLLILIMTEFSQVVIVTTALVAELHACWLTLSESRCFAWPAVCGWL